MVTLSLPVIPRAFLWVFSKAISELNCARHWRQRDALSQKREREERKREKEREKDVQSKIMVHKLKPKSGIKG
jgi:hypothetical protein